MFKIFRDEPLTGTVGHKIWPMQWQNPKCLHKGYIDGLSVYRCRYCGVKLKIKMKVKG